MHHGRRIGLSWHVLPVEDNAGILLLLLTGLFGFVLVLCVKVPQVSTEKILLLRSSLFLYYHRTIGVGLGSQFDLILSPLFWMEMEFLCGGTEGLLDRTRNDCRSAERVLSRCINKGRIRIYQSCRQLTGRFWIHFSLLTFSAELMKQVPIQLEHPVLNARKSQERKTPHSNLYLRRHTHKQSLDPALRIGEIKTKTWPSMRQLIENSNLEYRWKSIALRAKTTPTVYDTDSTTTLKPRPCFFFYLSPLSSSPDREPRPFSAAIWHQEKNRERL
ncbi:hypothetical protein V8C44DRAFT_269136 [Trichoderma aethiopicum]